MFLFIEVTLARYQYITSLQYSYLDESNKLLSNMTRVRCNISLHNIKMILLVYPHVHVDLSKHLILCTIWFFCKKLSIYWLEEALILNP